MTTDAARLHAVADHIEKHDLGGITSTVTVMNGLDVLLYADEGERLATFLRWVDTLRDGTEINTLATVGHHHLTVSGYLADGTEARVTVVTTGIESGEVAGEVMARKGTLVRSQLERLIANRRATS